MQTFIKGKIEDDKFVTEDLKYKKGERLIQ